MNELPIILDKDSILVGPEIADALGRPPHIQIQINEEKKRLLLQPCGVDEREAIVIPEVFPFRLSGLSLLKRIRRLTGWTDKRPRILYGYLIRGYNAIVFDLTTAEVIITAPDPMER